MVGRVEKTANDYEWDASQISISQVAHRHASEILPGDVFRRSASSIEDFICGIKPIFCSSTTQQIRLNLANFDTVAGIECTEAFLGKKTIGDWLLHIITEFLKPLRVSLSASSFSKSSSPAVAVTNPNKAPLDQKRLHHDPENLKPAWTPRQAGSSPVYHGSIVSNSHLISPLRAFLWAAFHSVMPRVTPVAADNIQTQNTWISGGKSYRGVVLFKFNSIQSASDDLTSYVIP
ncbi:hypothetical protein QIS74_10050 [Colletotrichum tabaci]|uniref:Uncharacterized protein n=1 Tax=Colletotrichum tabaci TaxID=1209068 RepID=A0AAV9T290_9PEZI